MSAEGTNGAAKKNDGRQLENIVAVIEAMRLPPGFTLEKRHVVRNAAGLQLAELDIFIKGQFGTATWTMLIECRDRPSEGSAPRSWIQQLIGRRDDLKLDKVMAVSSTGFAPGVAELAALKAIELRMCQTLTADAVANCFPAFAPLVMRKGIFDGAHIELESADLPADRHGTPVNLTPHQDCIVDNSTNDKLTLVELWNRILNAGDFFEGLKVNGEKRKQLVVVDKATRDAYAVELDGFSFRFSCLEFDAEFWIETSAMPLVHAASYTDGEGERLADVATWEGDPTDHIRKLTFIGIRRKGPTTT